MASWAWFFFSPLFSIYSYAICTYPEMRAVFWILGRAYGRSSNLYWVLPPTLNFLYMSLSSHTCTCTCTRAHMYTHTELYTHPHLHVSTDFSVGCPYRQPASVTGMIDIRSFTRFQFPVVVTGMDNQLEKVYMHIHTSTCTSLVQNMHTEVLCMLPIVFHDCISHALYRNDLHALCNHSHVTMFI